MDPVNVQAKFEVCTFIRSWDNNGKTTILTATESPVTTATARLITRSYKQTSLFTYLKKLSHYTNNTWFCESHVPLASDFPKIVTRFDQLYFHVTGKG